VLDCQYLKFLQMIGLLLANTVKMILLLLVIELVLALVLQPENYTYRVHPIHWKLMV